MNTAIRRLALLPLLFLPLACTDSTQPATGSTPGSTPNSTAGTATESVGGVQAAGKSLSDLAAGVMGSATSAGAATVSNGLAELQPRMDAAIAKLKSTGAELGTALQGPMESLTKYKDQIPALIEKLKSATGPELTAAVEQGKALLADIPQLLASLGA